MPPQGQPPGPGPAGMMPRPPPMGYPGMPPMPGQFTMGGPIPGAPMTGGQFITTDYILNFDFVACLLLSLILDSYLYLLLP
jgi:hypothetical protein